VSAEKKISRRSAVCPRTDFGTLLARAWKLYTDTLGVTFPVTLLCRILPVIAACAVLYAAVADVLEPLLTTARAGLLSLLENGFGEWALGNAVEQAQGWFGGEDILNSIIRVAISLGFAFVVLLAFIPVRLLCRLLLSPVACGASVSAQLAQQQGQRIRFGQAVAVVRRRYGRLVLLELIQFPVCIAVSIGVAALCWAAGKLPFGTGTVRLCVAVGATSLISGLRHLSVRFVLYEDDRAFRAFGRAFLSFFTDWTYIAAGGIFCGGLLVCSLLAFPADVFLTILAQLPPAAVLLVCALFLPLQQAICIVMAQEQSRRAATRSQLKNDP